MKKILILFVLISTTLFSQNITSDLVICMPMDGDANDYSGNNNHGTLVGATLTTDRFNNPAAAYNFNGTSNYIKVPNSNSLSDIETNDQITVSVWLKVNGWYQDHNVFSILNKYNISSDYGWDYSLQSPVSCTEQMFVPNYPAQPQWCVYTGTGTTTLGQWNHYAITFSKASGQFKAYKNGTLVSTVSSGSLEIESTGTSTLYIGYSPAGPDEYANGAMDDLRIYSRALTASEIMMLYNGATCSCPAIIMPQEITGPGEICMGSSYVYSVSPIPGAASYTWTLPNGWTGSSSVNTINIVPGAAPGTITVAATSTCGATGSTTLAVNVIDCNNTGLTSHSSSVPNVNIYPNPNNGLFCVEFQSPVDQLFISITDVLGKEICAGATFSGQKSDFDLKGNKGIYFLRIYNKDRKLIGVQKIVVN